MTEQVTEVISADLVIFRRSRIRCKVNLRFVTEMTSIRVNPRSPTFPWNPLISMLSPARYPILS